MPAKPGIAHWRKYRWFVRVIRAFQRFESTAEPALAIEPGQSRRNGTKHALLYLVNPLDLEKSRRCQQGSEDLYNSVWRPASKDTESRLRANKPAWGVR